MRGVRFTKAEVALIRRSIPHYSPPQPKTDEVWESILQKLRAAEGPAAVPGGVGPLEDALIATSRGKVVRLEGGHGMAYRMAENAKATVADMALVGAWISRQSWLSSPQTLIDVLKKWATWVPKARATEPPPRLQPGLGGHSDENQNPGTTRQGFGSNATVRGFR